MRAGEGVLSKIAESGGFFPGSRGGCSIEYSPLPLHRNFEIHIILMLHGSLIFCTLVLAPLFALSRVLHFFTFGDTRFQDMKRVFCPCSRLGVLASKCEQGLLLLFTFVGSCLQDTNNVLCPCSCLGACGLHPDMNKVTSSNIMP